ncbi:MAG: hypothetical protein HYR94_20860 [Chloroflexi bacterium]|nr:hypothetical protein [Chloroflexota bacterium]
MTMPSKRLILIAVLNLILQSIGAAIAIAQKLPYEFGGTGDPNNVAQDFVRGGGTALSAPLVPLLVLVVFIVLSLRQDWWGTLAVGGITLLAMLFTVAGWREPILLRTLQSSTLGLFEAIIIVLGLVGILDSLLMLLFGCWELVQRIKAQRRLKKV